MGLTDEIRRILRADPRNSQQIGEAANVHPVSIRHFKSGTRGLALDALDRLADVLGVRISVKKDSPKKR